MVYRTAFEVVRDWKAREKKFGHCHISDEEMETHSLYLNIHEFGKIMKVRNIVKGSKNVVEAIKVVFANSDE